jgi:hypothetical protein
METTGIEPATAWLQTGPLAIDRVPNSTALSCVPFATFEVGEVDAELS